MTPAAAAERKAGLLAALGAYLLWGLAPLYFKLLETVRADEIIAHRVIWSVIFLLLVLMVRRRHQLLQHLRISPGVLAALAISGSLIAANWLLFVYAVNSDRVLSTSLGYFINPLVSVMLGMVVFRETLDRYQVAALAIAAAGTFYLALAAGQWPWIALGLAVSFALYGLVRKLVNVGPMVGLFWETLLIAPFAMFWLYRLELLGTVSFRNGDLLSDLLLAGTGLVTVIPLLLFVTAARRLPLSVLGFMQYLAPSITFLLAVFLFREPFTLDHAIAFGAIWLALVIFSIGGWSRARRARIPV